MTPYNGYVIEAFQSSSRTWRVQVRRQDGLLIESVAGCFEFITPGIDSKSAHDATMAAKSMIDGLFCLGGLA